MLLVDFINSLCDDVYIEIISNINYDCISLSNFVWKDRYGYAKHDEYDIDYDLHKSKYSDNMSDIMYKGICKHLKDYIKSHSDKLKYLLVDSVSISYKNDYVTIHIIE